MAKRSYTAQFYADDKDIADLLAAEKKALPTKRLLQVARERGIFLSESDERERLVDYIGCLQFDWSGLGRLFEMTEREDRAEKKTSSIVRTDADVSDAVAVAEILKSDRESRRGEAITVQQTTNSVTIEVEYTELDESRTRLNQRRSRKLTVQMERTSDGYKVRHEANQRAEEIVAELLEELANGVEEPPERRTIELSGIHTPDVRTAFFLDLMKGVPGCSLHDVNSVSVDRLPAPEEPAEDSDSDDDASSSPKPEDAEMTALVRHVLLRGASLLGSREYSSLTAAGFFVTRAIWVVEQNKKDGGRFELEAEFEDGPSATGFRYAVRGVFTRNRQGEFNKTRRAVSEVERQEFVERIETAAQASLDKAESSASMPLLLPKPVSEAAGE